MNRFFSQPEPIRSISVNISWQKLTWLVAGFGVCIRIYHFLLNRSLWLDEIYLSSSILKMDFLQLAIDPLDYQQQAPLGFLLAVKACVVMFGPNEMALRLVSLVCGILSIIVCHFVARHFLKPPGIFVAVSIVALAPFLIFHSTEIKQYSIEMLASACVLLLYVKYSHKKDLLSLVTWGMSGALIVWFSYSSIFVLAGIAFGMSLRLAFRQDWRVLFPLLLPFSLWLISFIVNYILYIYTPHRTEWLTRWFMDHNSYLPLSSIVEAVKWIAFQFYRVLEYPLGLLWNWDTSTFDSFILRNFLRMPLLPSLLFVLGLAALFQKDKKSFMILIFPVLLTLIASGLQFYPVYERLTVFLSPILVILIAKGAENLVYFRWTRRYSYLLIALLLANPVVSSTRQLLIPEEMGGYKNTEYREALEYVNDRYQPGDVVYIYWNFVAQYKVYKQLTDINYDAVEGADVRETSSDNRTYFIKLERDFKKLEGRKRVWLIYENNLNFNIGDMNNDTWYHQGFYGVNPGKRILSQFKSMGQLIHTYHSKQVSAHLFNLEK